MLLEQERHIEELQRLEAEAVLIKVKQEAESAERQRVLEAKRRELDRLETIKKLKAAKARQQVYNQSECSARSSKGDCSDEEINELLHHHVSAKKEERVRPQTSALQHCSPQQVVTHSEREQHNSLPQAVSQDRPEDGTAALVRLFAESISASRIPLPEPTVFNGDPLRFNDWKASFQTLVDRKNILADEKIYYLRKYCMWVDLPRRPSRATSWHRVSLLCSMAHPRRAIWQSIPYCQGLSRQDRHLAQDKRRGQWGTSRIRRFPA